MDEGQGAHAQLHKKKKQEKKGTKKKKLGACRWVPGSGNPGRAGACRVFKTPGVQVGARFWPRFQVPESAAFQVPESAAFQVPESGAFRKGFMALTFCNVPFPKCPLEMMVAFVCAVPFASVSLCAHCSWFAGQVQATF